MARLSVADHERRLRQLPCAVSMMTPVTLHHCHGASIKRAGWHVGMGQKQNPFLQIPLHARYHVGQDGIDSGVGVETWESRYGGQAEHLDWVSAQLGYSVWDQARAWEEEHRGKSQVRRETH
jgi:hypothetical protein